jgi:hypothetical protein
LAAALPEDLALATVFDAGLAGVFAVVSTDLAFFFCPQLQSWAFFQMSFSLRVSWQIALALCLLGRQPCFGF